MMEKPKIELKKVTMSVNLSEETPAYTADVFIDGSLFASVSNHGTGGCDNVYPPKGQEKGFRDRLEALEKRIADSYPKETITNWEDKEVECTESFEGLCHELAFEFVDKRNFRSQLTRKVLAFDDGKIFIYKGKKSEQLMDAVAKQRPTATILNRVTFDTAWDLSKQAA